MASPHGMAGLTNGAGHESVELRAAIRDDVSRTYTREPRGLAGLVLMVRLQTLLYLTYLRRTWRTVITGVVGPTMYMVAMGVILGSYVKSDALAPATSYTQFVASGLFASNLMMTMWGGAAYGTMNCLVWSKTYFAIMQSPLRLSGIVAGAVILDGAARGTLSGVLFVLMAACFGVVDPVWGVALVPLATLISAAFYALWYVLGVWAKSEVVLSVTYRLVLMPLFLFSGAFFPVAQLGGAAALVHVTPLFHAVEISRAVMSGVVTPGVWVHVVYLVGVLVTAWAVASVLLRRRVES